MSDAEDIAHDRQMHEHMGHLHWVCGHDGSRLNPPGSSYTAPCLDSMCDVTDLRARLAESEEERVAAERAGAEMVDSAGRWRLTMLERYELVIEAAQKVDIETGPIPTDEECAAERIDTEALQYRRDLRAALADLVKPRPPGN